MAEYEKELKEMITNIQKEETDLLSKKDLLDRFLEVSEEFGQSLTLLQILANINILIGEKDVAPVVHSDYEPINGNIKYVDHIACARCITCGQVTQIANYCAWCGAKMDKE